VTPLVFIHGRKGSVLTDHQGNVRWLTWRQAFGLSSCELSLPLHWDGEVQQRDELSARGPLRGVAWHRVYAPFLKWASASNRSFHTFAYDWRRDNLESTEELIKFLEKVSKGHGGARIQIVAHSMGGLITFVALNQRPELLHSVLFAGVPFGSTISFLEDMHAGAAIGLNKRILRPQVLFTFVSLYSLFSADPHHSGLVEGNGERILHDWYSPDDWVRMKLGIFALSHVDRTTPEQQEHLRHALGRSRKFRMLLAANQAESFRYPPIAVLANDTHPTLSTIIRNGPRSVRGWDFQTAVKEPGDGRVVLVNAMPPVGVPYTIWRTPRRHSDLVNDTKQVGAILGSL
jgi:pimeloyl-ACP methyl ester carboxylesterase